MGTINWYYTFVIVVIAAGGIPKGYDEGGFSAAVTLASFKNDFDLNASQWKHDASGLANRTANITSFGVLGAAFGSLIALALTDRLGRLRTWQLLVLTWGTGCLMQTFSSGIYGFMLFARIWGGLGAGGLTVVAPLYLSEIAPAKSRGMVVSIYMVLLLLWLSLGFYINYGASTNMEATQTQYRTVIAVPLIPTGLAFIGSFFLPDTPRWLASEDRGAEALRVLARLRDCPTSDPRLSLEYSEIRDQIQLRQQNLAGVSTWTIIKEIATIGTYRKRFLLALFMQTVAQWSGGNGITYYIPTIFTYAGVSGANQSLITSGAYGLVKLVFTLVFTWGLVDLLGRRFCTLWGLGLQCVSHIWMAIYMSVFLDSNNKSASDAAIASVFVYAVGWSIGLCTVQYIYATEIFPTRIRSVCYGANMAVHWFFQFAVVRVTPNMFVSLHVWGAYVFWAVICAVGLGVLGLWMPETRGVPMESMEMLFEGRWWMLWRAGVEVGDEGVDGRGKKDGATAGSIPTENKRVTGGDVHEVV